jgi:DNA-3-methyladenine glycosylase II
MITPTDWNDVISNATAYLSDIDPIMAKAIERVGPCTLIPNPHLFETLVDAIISQQISVKAADAIMGRLRAVLHAEAEGMVSPEALLTLEEDTLRAVGLSLSLWRRGPRVHALHLQAAKRDPLAIAADPGEHIADA